MINCKQLAYVTMGVPDLDVMERFLEDFGMKRNSRTADKLYMRGAESTQYIYVAEKSSASNIISFAFEAAMEEDLIRASKLPGASAISDIDGPGGGKSVSLTTPGGFKVEVVHGIERLEELPVREAYELNFSKNEKRFNKALRPNKYEPGIVLGFRHLVTYTLDADADVAWYREHFGMLPSDYICDPADKSVVHGTFLRFDHGAEFIDHHQLLIVKSPSVGCHHTSFEMIDLDAIASAHDYLLDQGHKLDSGYGRHYLGSLIYDYWFDPFGNRIEHYTDSDQLDASYEPEYFAGTADQTTQWGPLPPEDFFSPERDFERRERVLKSLNLS